jgi:hypothetical protein
MILPTVYHAFKWIKMYKSVKKSLKLTLNVLNKYFSISSVGILDAFNFWDGIKQHFICTVRKALSAIN